MSPHPTPHPGKRRRAGRPGAQCGGVTEGLSPIPRLSPRRIPSCSCSEALNLCQKEGCWWRSASLQPSTRARPCGRSVSLFETPLSPQGARHLDSHSLLLRSVPVTRSSNIYRVPRAVGTGQTPGRLQRGRGHGASSQRALILSLILKSEQLAVKDGARLSTNKCHSPDVR